MTEALREKAADDKRVYEAVKRGFDIFGAIFGIIISLPLTSAVALAVRLSDGGPAIYRRVCVGKDNKTYNMYKFRTMVADADNLERWLTPEQLREYREESKIENDPRITKLGKLLRQTSIDELPQFISVLKNDMSFVGPRPITEAEKAHYSEGQLELLFSAKPGITGWWQVNGRSNVGYEGGKRQELELYYVKHRSLLLDTKILFSTVGTVISRGGCAVAGSVLYGDVFLFLKRLFDCSASCLLLLVLAPLLGGVALAIKASDGGPAIYRRVCVGKDNKTYNMYKFRTMVADADNLERWLTPEQLREYREECKLENDPRITKLGKFLRKMSIDELPQLFSVLHNDMSLVGPRPVVEGEAEAYGSDRARLLSVKPGITGWWQISARSSIPFLSDEAKALQLYYTEHRSLPLDLKILFKTPKVVLKGTNAK